LRPGTAAAVVGALGGCVAAAGVAGQWMEYRLGVDHSFGFVRSFDLDQEGNLATWFSVALLLLNATVLGSIALVRHGERGGWAWAGLSRLLLAMSVEEGAALHEMTVLPLRHLLDAGGLLYYTWVVPGALFVLCVAAVYLPFLVRLPVRTRNLFFLAGFVYVGGVIGFEMISGRHAALYGIDNLGYKLLAHVEETLEMAGQVILLYALLDYVGLHAGPITLRVAAGRAAERFRHTATPQELPANGEVRAAALALPATAAARHEPLPVSRL
jgi:hypothetical protein